ncbi:MAG TPA: response regulator transcription factor [Gaiellaceae bacterium]
MRGERPVPTATLEHTAVLLDSQPLVLAALSSVLGQHDVAVVATTTTNTAALRDVEALQPTVFVLDPWLEDEAMTGLDLIALLRERVPELKIVCLGSVDRTAHIDAVFGAGADAYVLKAADTEDVARAIKHFCSDVIWFSAPSLQRGGAPPLSVRGSVETELTKREVQILRLVSEGHSNGDVARLLCVTEQTVKFHLSNVYRKLGVSNRTEAGRWAHLHGIVPAQQPRPDDLADDLRLRIPEQS